MATNGAVQLGLTHKLYYDADGDIATPAWVEATICQGLTANLEYDQVDIKERGLGFTTVALGHGNVPFEITMTRRTSNSIYAAFKAAATAKTKIGLAVMNGPIATIGTKGWQGEFKIVSNGDDQAADSATETFTCRMDSEYTTAPAFVTIAS